LGRIDVSLYVILDRAIERRFTVGEFTALLIDGGATCLQVRCKEGSARSIMDFTREVLGVARGAGVPVIVNDRIDIALAADADGVHLGEYDLAVSDARHICGQDLVIGATVRDAESAARAEAAGADYLGVGPIFKTWAKPRLNPIPSEVLSRICREISLPIVAIGGINETNAAQPLQQGADGVAVISALRRCAHPKEAAIRLRAVIDEAKKR